MYKIPFLIIILLVTSFAAQASEVDLSRVKKVYYLLASSKGMTRSAFGHGYLRLGESEKPSSRDYVIEFVADVPEDELSIVRAIGIGENYQRSVVMKRYSQIMPQMNNIADRDLTSYEILLSDDQREKFLAELTRYLEEGSMDNYSFFRKNCSEAVSSLLRVVGVNAGRLRGLIPTALPKVLEKQGLIGSVTADLSLSGRRVQLTEKYSETLKKVLSDLVFDLKDLSSSDLQMRLSAFAALAEESFKLRGDELRILKTYLSSVSFLENRVTRNMLIDKLTGEESFKLQEVVSQDQYVNSSFTQFSVTQSVKVSEVNFQYDGSDVWIKFTILIRGNNPKEATKSKYRYIKIKLDNIEFRDSDVYLKGKFIGILAPESINENRIIATHAWISDLSDYNKKTRTLRLKAVVTSQELFDFDKKKALKKNEATLKNNIPEMPMCFGLVDLQKNLLEKVIFQRDRRALSAEENLFLVSELMRGSIVIVPGHENIQEWMSSLNQEKLASLIYSYQLQNYSSVMGAVKTYFKQKSLNLEGIKLIDSMTKKGIQIPIFFETKFKIGHAILVTGITEKGAHEYFIEAYDPNLNSGFTKDIFIYNTQTEQLTSFLYGTNTAYFLRPNSGEDFFSRDMSLDKDMKNYLIYASEKLNKYTFSINEILMGY
jgi:hypothetical protein